MAVPGRLERLAEAPPVFVDVAHNPDGAAALAEALPEVAGDRPVVACLAVLADKDAEGIAAALAPALERAICTEVPARRPSTPAAELAAACRRAGLPAEAEPEFGVALRRARELAAGPPVATLLIAGSHYLLGPARAAVA